MRILLTGSTGQVGHAMLSALQGLGEIIILPRGKMDLSNPDLLRSTIREIQPNLIINPAAYTAVHKAESESELAHMINAVAPGIMAEEASKLGAVLIHYSTDYVFDGSKCDANGDLIPYTEQDTPCPTNVYGRTKLEGEQAVRSSGCNHLIFRTSWIYSTFGKNFLLTMLRLVNQRDELKVVNDQWGAPNYAEWIAKTTADIIMQLQNSESAQDWWRHNSGLYNLTPAGVTSWCGFTEVIVRLAVLRRLLSKAAPRLSGIPTSKYSTPPRRPVNSCMSIQSLASNFGLLIPTWQAALAKCLVQENSCP